MSLTKQKALFPVTTKWKIKFSFWRATPEISVWTYRLWPLLSLSGNAIDPHLSLCIKNWTAFTCFWQLWGQFFACLHWNHSGIRKKNRFQIWISLSYWWGWKWLKILEENYWYLIIFPIPLYVYMNKSKRINVMFL